MTSHVGIEYLAVLVLILFHSGVLLVTKRLNTIEISGIWRDTTRTRLGRMCPLLSFRRKKKNLLFDCELSRARRNTEISFLSIQI